MRCIRTLLGAIAALLLVAATIVSAAVPNKVSIQGRLTNSAGSAVPDGNYVITFSLWDDPVAGSMLASEIQNVSVSGGLFSVNLEYDGEKFASGSVRYLQYQIQGDPPITPRVLVTATPYALISSGVSGDIETSARQIKVRRGSITAANFRMVADDDADQVDVEVKPDSSKIRLIRHSSGDPDFDLLRIVGGSSNSMGTQVDGGLIAITGDPDFDLLRISADADSAKIRISGQSSGDPDFDLLRIVGGGGPTAGKAEIAMGGDPDFDLLRVSANKDSAKIRISGQSSGDPDFDLLRIVGGTTSGGHSAEISIGGDPDFDLLRMKAGLETAGGFTTQTSSLTMGGDPDFDLLRISNGVINSLGGIKRSSELRMTGDPDFDLLTLSADADSAKLRISGQSSGDPDFDLLRITGGVGSSSQGAEISMGGDPDFDLLRMSADADLVKIRISGQNSGDPDFDLLRITGGVGSGTQGASISMGGDPDFDLLRINADADSASIDVGSSFYLDATRSNDDEVVKTFSWKQLGGPLVTRMEMRADSLGSSMMCRGLYGRDVLLIADQNGADIRITDALSNVSMEMHGEGRLGVGKAADNAKRIDVLGGAFCNGTNWVNASDANSKENFRPIDAQDLLNKLAQLEITEWNYRGEGENTRHIGPTAQDFYKLFGIGNDDKSISTIDPAGISLVAIKELYKKSKEVDQLKQQVDELSKQLREIREQLKQK